MNKETFEKSSSVEQKQWISWVEKLGRFFVGTVHSQVQENRIKVNNMRFEKSQVEVKLNSQGFEKNFEKQIKQLDKNLQILIDFENKYFDQFMEWFSIDFLAFEAISTDQFLSTFSSLKTSFERLEQSQEICKTNEQRREKFWKLLSEKDIKHLAQNDHPRLLKILSFFSPQFIQPTLNVLFAGDTLSLAVKDLLKFFQNVEDNNVKNQMFKACDANSEPERIAAISQLIQSTFFARNSLFVTR